MYVTTCACVFVGSSGELATALLQMYSLNVCVCVWQTFASWEALTDVPSSWTLQLTDAAILQHFALRKAAFGQYSNERFAIVPSAFPSSVLN